MPSPIACPSCGAPAAGDPDGICDFCQQHLPKDPPPPAPPPAGWSGPPVVVVQRGARRGCGIAAAIAGVAVLAVVGVVVWVGLVAARGVSDVTADIRKQAAAAAEDVEDLSAGDVDGPLVGPRAHLVVGGAESFDGTIPIGAACTQLSTGSLQLTIQDGATSWSVLAAPPDGAAGAGSHPIGGRNKAFVSVNKTTGGATATWGSLLKDGASGTITRGADGGFQVAFASLPAVSGPAAGAVSGTLDLVCA